MTTRPDPQHAPFPIKDGPEHKTLENGDKPGPATPAPVVPTSKP